MGPGSLAPSLPLGLEFWGWSCSAVEHLTSDLSPQGSLKSSGLFQPMHSAILPRRAGSLQGSFTNPLNRLLCRVILCRALSSGSKTLPENRSPERPGTGAGLSGSSKDNILHGKTSSKRETLCVQQHLPKVLEALVHHICVMMICR